MIKDSILTMRARRLVAVTSVRLRRFGLRILPYALALVLGIHIGESLESTRIHNDCKFTNTFRIAYTGYACKIGRE